MEIVVLTVTPCASKNSYGITMKMINNYNEALTEAANDGDFILIDVCSDFKNGDGYIKSVYVQPDGLHLTQKGYKELLAMVQFELEQKSEIEKTVADTSETTATFETMTDEEVTTGEITTELTTESTYND